MSESKGILEMLDNHMFIQFQVGGEDEEDEGEEEEECPKMSYRA